MCKILNYERVKMWWVCFWKYWKIRDKQNDEKGRKKKVTDGNRTKMREIEKERKGERLCKFLGYREKRECSSMCPKDQERTQDKGLIMHE